MNDEHDSPAKEASGGGAENFGKVIKKCLLFSLFWT